MMGPSPLPSTFAILLCWCPPPPPQTLVHTDLFPKGDLRLLPIELDLKEGFRVVAQLTQ